MIQTYTETRTLKQYKLQRTIERNIDRMQIRFNKNVKFLVNKSCGVDVYLCVCGCVELTYDGVMMWWSVSWLFEVCFVCFPTENWNFHRTWQENRIIWHSIGTNHCIIGIRLCHSIPLLATIGPISPLEFHRMGFPPHKRIEPKKTIFLCVPWRSWNSTDKMKWINCTNTKKAKYTEQNMLYWQK